jgi:hypothetical protein
MNFEQLLFQLYGNAGDIPGRPFSRTAISAAADALAKSARTAAAAEREAVLQIAAAFVGTMQSRDFDPAMVNVLSDDNIRRFRILSAAMLETGRPRVELRAQLRRALSGLFVPDQIMSRG